MAQAVCRKVPGRSLAQAEFTVLARGQVENIEGRDCLLARADMGEEIAPAEAGRATAPRDKGVVGQVAGPLGLGQRCKIFGGGCL